MMLHTKNSKLRATISGSLIIAVVLVGLVTGALRPAGALTVSHPFNPLQRHLLLRYKLLVLDTLGGPQSFGDAGHGAATDVLNNGTVSGTADTATADPNFPKFNPLMLNTPVGDPFVFPAFLWKYVPLLDLGAPPGHNSSTSSWITQNGLICGQSLNGVSTIANAQIIHFPSQPRMHFQARPFAHEHTRYRLIDLGTFGGPDSVNNGGSVIINSEGTVVGAADTPEKDPYAPACFDPECYVQHAFKWQHGAVIDLGVLPKGYSSYTNAINSSDIAVGFSQNGLIDPGTGIPEFVSTVWARGQKIDLGTFGGPFSLAAAVNDQDVVVGGAENVIADPYLFAQFFGVFGSTQLRAFQWQGGHIHDLGTLGSGNDAFALFVNQNGLVVGASFSNSIPNPTTGMPTMDPFLWMRGKIYDLGTLGGTRGFPGFINNVGDVVGQSNLAGDKITHPFLWRRGLLSDLGTFGGTFGTATAVSDSDDIIGFATYPGDQLYRAFLWRRGVLTDLGSVTGNEGSSFAFSINSRGQIVGQSFNSGDSRAFLWQNGGHMLDLNELVPAGSGIKLAEAHFINDRGEIVAVGVLPNGDFHSVVLLPCDDRAQEEGCEESAQRQNDVSPYHQAPLTRVIQLLYLRRESMGYWAAVRASLSSHYNLR